MPELRADALLRIWQLEKRVASYELNIAGILAESGNGTAQGETVKGITQKQADLIATIHKTLQGEYGEQSQTLLRNSLLAWARTEKLKRRARPESNKSRKKNAKNSRSSKGKKKKQQVSLKFARFS